MVAKIFEWIGIVLGSLLVIAIVTVSVLNAVENPRRTKQVEVLVESVVVPTDPESIEQGRKWAAGPTGTQTSTRAIL